MLSRTEKNKNKRKKINKQEQREKRKKIFFKTMKVLFMTFLLILFILAYVFFVSTRQLTVKEYSNEYTSLPKEFNGFKIIHFGNLYYDDFYDEMLNQYIEVNNSLKPDIVLFTGGLINKEYKLSDSKKEELINKLNKIDSSLGKYYVLTKSDNETTIDILNKANFVFLNNESKLIYYNGQTPIELYGIMDIYNIKNESKNFKIILSNDPNNIKEILSKATPNILFSAKYKNSQIKIPYLDNFVENDNYIEGWTREKTTDIYITNGLGTGNYPIRLFNHPSINFIRLRASK